MANVLLFNMDKTEMRVKQTAGSQAFSYRAEFLWNCLPIHVRDADSVWTHLFSRSYD
jgi:hypothetical protein